MVQAVAALTREKQVVHLREYFLQRIKIKLLPLDMDHQPEG